MLLRENDFKAIPHKDCATDASSNFSSDETKSGVNTWCIHEHFCEIWESVSYLTYADCVVRFFERWREKRRKSFVDFRVFSRNISKNMHARCVREDTKQALKGNLQADGVQSRQTLFVRYCLKVYHWHLLELGCVETKPDTCLFGKIHDFPRKNTTWKTLSKPPDLWNVSSVF